MFWKFPQLQSPGSSMMPSPMHGAQFSHSQSLSSSFMGLSAAGDMGNTHSHPHSHDSIRAASVPSGSASSTTTGVSSSGRTTLVADTAASGTTRRRSTLFFGDGPFAFSGSTIAPLTDVCQNVGAGNRHEDIFQAAERTYEYVVVFRDSIFMLPFLSHPLHPPHSCPCAPVGLRWFSRVTALHPPAISSDLSCGPVSHSLNSHHPLWPDLFWSVPSLFSLHCCCALQLIPFPPKCIHFSLLSASSLSVCVCVCVCVLLSCPHFLLGLSTAFNPSLPLPFFPSPQLYGVCWPVS